MVPQALGVWPITEGSNCRPKKVETYSYACKWRPPGVKKMNTNPRTVTARGFDHLQRPPIIRTEVSIALVRYLIFQGYFGVTSS
jgi:hypothetical protein